MLPLAVIGNVNVDLILGPAPAWPQAGTEILVEHDELRVGGSAGNTSLAWQALKIQHQISATVGSDDYGDWLRKSFGRLAKEWPTCESRTTLSVGITHPNNERTFFTTQGHLPHMSLQDVLANLDIEALRGGIALLCGSFLTNRLTEDYVRLFEIAQKNGFQVALDTGWPVGGWTAENRARACQWLGVCDYVLSSENEIASLSGQSEQHDAARAVKAMMKPDATLIVKLGPLGALGLSAEDGIVKVPAPSVPVIDTIGAGDVFNAGFLAACAQRAPLERCLATGVAIASQAISTAPRRYDFQLETALRETSP